MIFQIVFSILEKRNAIGRSKPLAMNTNIDLSYALNSSVHKKAISSQIKLAAKVKSIPFFDLIDNSFLNSFSFSVVIFDMFFKCYYYILIEHLLHAGNYIILYTSSNGTLNRSPQIPSVPFLIPQGITILISAPQGSLSNFFTLRLSNPSKGQVS